MRPQPSSSSVQESNEPPGLYASNFPEMGIYLTKVTPTSCGFTTSGATWDLTKDL